LTSIANRETSKERRVKKAKGRLVEETCRKASGRRRRIPVERKRKTSIQETTWRARLWRLRKALGMISWRTKTTRIKMDFSIKCKRG
jgi:hypothetical protein